MKPPGLAVGSYGSGHIRESPESVSVDVYARQAGVGVIRAMDDLINSVDKNLENRGSNRLASAFNLTAFAAESAEMGKADILQWADTAMRAQANASSQRVLLLLR